MKKILAYLIVIISSAVIIALSAFGPSVLTRYRDASILDRVETEPAVGLAEGFRYSLTGGERLYILSMALQKRSVPQSNYAALVRERATGPDSPSSFAYTENRRGPSLGELTYDEALEACGETLEALRESGVLPDFRFDPESDTYDVRLYTAVDMSDPQRNISVWQIVYEQDQPVSTYHGALLEAWMDAETGVLYGFSLRTDSPPETFNPDAIIDAWLSHTGLNGADPIIDDNPLLETTPHYKKYAVEGLDNDSTIITVGYYEGINEFFLRIT